VKVLPNPALTSGKGKGNVSLFIVKNQQKIRGTIGKVGWANRKHNKK
jgi:hypothetical protein